MNLRCWPSSSSVFGTPYVLSAGVRLMATGSGVPNKPKNRLANEKSPYLLQHANNPVDW